MVPRSERVAFLDATKPLPFDDNSFDYVYSEHMIEHISWADGQSMLKECRRILKPGGTIRIATPDLAVLLGLYGHKKEPLKDRYIQWITNRFIEGIQVSKAPFVINNAFRNWGHQFIYDGELLEMALKESGFTNARRYGVGESDDMNLKRVETHGTNVADEEMVAFETMVFEARSP